MKTMLQAIIPLLGAVSLPADPLLDSPTPEQQQQIIALIRRVAQTHPYNISENLIYEQMIETWRRRDPSKKWHHEVTNYSTRLRHNQEELWRPSGPNGKSAGKWRDASVGCSEDIYGELSHIQLTWMRWEDVRGHLSAAFSFTIPDLWVSCKLFSGQTHTHKATYSGIIYADPESGRIWRMYYDMRCETPVDADCEATCQELFDYDVVAIGRNQQIIEAVHRVEMTQFPDREEKIEWNWSNFRRFQADSTVTYTPH